MKPHITIPVDFSSLALLGCERRYVLKTIAGLDRISDATTQFGTVFHKFAAHVINQVETDETYLAAISFATRELDEVSRRKVTPLLLAVLSEFRVLITQLPKPTHIEQWFEIEYRTVETDRAVYQFILCGHIDLVCAGPLVYDFKTTLSPFSSKLDIYRTTLQLQIYSYVWGRLHATPLSTAFIFVQPNSKTSKVSLSAAAQPNDAAVVRALDTAIERIISIYERLPEVRPTGRLTNACELCDFTPLCFADKLQQLTLLNSWPTRPFNPANYGNPTSSVSLPSFADTLTSEG